MSATANPLAGYDPFVYGKVNARDCTGALCAVSMGIDTNLRSDRFNLVVETLNTLVYKFLVPDRINFLDTLEAESDEPNCATVDCTFTSNTPWGSCDHTIRIVLERRVSCRDLNRALRDFRRRAQFVLRNLEEFDPATGTVRHPYRSAA